MGSSVESSARTALSDVVTDWLKAAGRIPLLTPAEEIHLATLVQTWLQHPDPVPRNIERAGKRAKDRMIKANLRLVVTIAQKYRARLHNSGLEMEDLLQEGVIGLTRGIEKFDPTRGFKASTYLYWWCRQSMGRITDAAGIMKTPTSATALLRRWRYRPADQGLDEFCEEHNYSPDQVRKEIEHAARAKVGSLDCTAREDDHGCTAIGELIASDETCTLESYDYAEAVEVIRSSCPDELAVIECELEGAKRTELAALMDTNTKVLGQRLEEVRQRLVDACPSHVAAMMGQEVESPIAVLDRPDFHEVSPLPMTVELPATSSNGHNAQALEACLEAPAAKPRRKRRTKAEIEAAKAAKAPAVMSGTLTMAMGGAEIKGGPVELAALLREINRAA